MKRNNKIDMDVLSHSMDDVKDFKKSYWVNLWHEGLGIMVFAFIFTYLAGLLLFNLQWEFLVDKNQYIIGGGIAFMMLGLVGEIFNYFEKKERIKR